MPRVRRVDVTIAAARRRPRRAAGRAADRHPLRPDRPGPLVGRRGRRRSTRSTPTSSATPATSPTAPSTQRRDAGRAARRRPGPAGPGLRDRQPRVLRRGRRAGWTTWPSSAGRRCTTGTWWSSAAAPGWSSPASTTSPPPAPAARAPRRPRRRAGRRRPRRCRCCCWPTSPSRSAAPSTHGVDLQLSGHTHGGQIWPFHFLVRADQPVVQGLTRHGERTQLYTSRGTGFWGPPFRWLVDSAQWAQWQRDLQTVVDDWAKARPLTPGMPRTAAAQRLDLPDPAVLELLVRQLPDLVIDGDGVHRRDAATAFPPEINGARRAHKAPDGSAIRSRRRPGTRRGRTHRPLSGGRDESGTSDSPRRRCLCCRPRRMRRFGDWRISRNRSR